MRGPIQELGNLERFHRTFTRKTLTLLFMRKSPVLLAGAISASLIFGSSPALAQKMPKPKIEKQQRKEVRDLINYTFKKAIDKANADARLAISQATTVEAKVAARAAQKAAVIEATLIRDSALSALGPALNEVPDQQIAPQDVSKSAPRLPKPKRN